MKNKQTKSIHYAILLLAVLEVLEALEDPLTLAHQANPGEK
jgi:hypothetical protein